MNFEEAITTRYFDEKIAELTGEVYLDRWPSLAQKCKEYRDAKVFISGQVFVDKVFHNCTIFGSGTFTGCYFVNCLFSPVQGSEAVLSFMGDVLRDCTLRGRWNNFIFLPKFCKDVRFDEDFHAMESTIKFACVVSQGLIVPPAVWNRLQVVMGKALNGGLMPKYEPDSPMSKAEQECLDFLAEYGEKLDL